MRASSLTCARLSALPLEGSERIELQERVWHQISLFESSNWSDRRISAQIWRSQLIFALRLALEFNLLLLSEYLDFTQMLSTLG